MVLLAGFYHIAFAFCSNLWPFLCFDLMGIAHPNHPALWRGIGLVSGLLGIALLIASRNPIQHWSIILVGVLKSLATLMFVGSSVYNHELPTAALGLLLVDDAIFIPPFLGILWAALGVHSGVPLSRKEPLSIQEAAGVYTLSNGKTLSEASENQVIVLVFLRHFGCTFTRQILRGLESIQEEAATNHAELVLVHMLHSGKETAYLGSGSQVPRIADPLCELYRAFGLGKGGFLELFGPHVWWRGALALFKGCGIGHLAGDGMQMPGAFLFYKGQIVAAQPAHSASDLPNLTALFRDNSISALPA